MTMTEADRRAGPAAAHQDLVADLKAELAQARLGGPERSRARHEERGKLLPRDRSGPPSRACASSAFRSATRSWCDAAGPARRSASVIVMIVLPRPRRPAR